jgi:hypothetical protein
VDSTGSREHGRGAGQASPSAVTAPPAVPTEAISFALERLRYAGFVGRAGLLAQLDQLLVADAIDCCAGPAGALARRRRE